MPARRTLRRIVAAASLTLALAAGIATTAGQASHAPEHSVADSTWGGITPANPSPTPTITDQVAYAPMDSTWGG